MEAGQGSGSFSASWRGRFRIAPKFRIYVAAFGLQGPIHFMSSFLRSARFRGRGPARNRVVFINSGRERGKKGRRPEAVVSLTWPYTCGRSRPPSANGGKRPPKDPPLMKTSRFLAVVPLFFCHGSSQGAWASGCAGADSPARASRMRIELLRAVESAVESRRRAYPSPRQAILLQSNSSKYYVFVILLPC